MKLATTHAPRLLEWAADRLAVASSGADRLAARLVDHRKVIDQPRQLTTDTVSHSTFLRGLRSVLETPKARSTVSILAVSVDYFDVLLASHGPAVAREVLIVAASRLRAAVRRNDPVTRLGVDGFALMWAPVGPAVPAAELAERIAAMFDEPVETSTGQLPITVSIGVASAHTEAESAPTDAQTLHHRAEVAVGSAKERGRAQLVVFDPAVQEQAIQSYETERRLRVALHDNTVSVHYQPIVSLHSGAVMGVEALARWNDETLGSISPTTFIPIAEESGLISELGRLVLQNAIAQRGSWKAGNEAMLTVNVSNRQLLDPDLPSVISALLETHGVQPEHLCLEITESVVMSNVAASMTILGHLKDLGVCLAIDDFGTGYSSLSYLRRLPVDILKIDRSFVQSVYNRDDRMITKAIIDLAHTLGMTTVAEGIETQLQLEVLIALKCDMAQGYLLQTPTSADDVDFTRIDFSRFRDETEPTITLNGSPGLALGHAMPRERFVLQ